MFQREILEDLDTWKNSENRKPLILRGARQVGKTSIVYLFGEKFKQYVYMNLELSDDRNLFEQYQENDLLTEAIFLKKIKMLKKATRFYLLMKYRRIRLQLNF